MNLDGLGGRKARRIAAAQAAAIAAENARKQAEREQENAFKVDEPESYGNGFNLDPLNFRIQEDKYSETPEILIQPLEGILKMQLNGVYPDIKDLHDVNTFAGIDVQMGEFDIQKAVDSITTAIPKIQTAVNQQKIFNAQLKVAKKIASQNNDPAAFNTAIATTQDSAAYKAQIGLDANTRKLVIYGGLGLLALLLLTRSRG